MTGQGERHLRDLLQPENKDGRRDVVCFMKQTKKTETNSPIALGAALGVAFGAAFGAAFGNVAIGVALGVAFGPAIGAAFGAAAKRSDE